MADSNIDNENLPVHIGIIMDGNGRWAQKRGLARSAGHSEGLKRAKEIVRVSSELGIKYVTLYVFSTENWKRTAEETGHLMNLIHVHLKAEFDFYKKNGIRLMHIGDRNGLPSQVCADIDDAIRETQNYTGTTLVMAINYGGRDEIVRGIKKILADGKSADADIELTEDAVKKVLDCPTLPDVDLLIRTGGEKRLSNFLLWQSSYAELVFTDTLWPDYFEDEYLKDIEEFKRRQRRFGAVVEDE